MTHLAEVVTLRTSSLNDVPAKLRDFADQIESGMHGEDVRVCLAMDSEFGMDIRSIGRLNNYEAIALMQLAASQMIHTTLANMAEEE